MGKLDKEEKESNTEYVNEQATLMVVWGSFPMLTSIRSYGMLLGGIPPKK